MPKPRPDRKALAATLRTLSDLMSRDEEEPPPRDSGRRRDLAVADGDCFFCAKTDEVLEDDEPDPDDVRDKLAEACAYGLEVLALGHGVFACDDCDRALRRARTSARRDLRSAKPT